MQLWSAPSGISRQCDGLGGINVDDSKIEVVKNWPAPNTVKALIGFLGLTGYYRKLRNYGLIAKPLTNLLKKGQFAWTE